MRYFKNEEELMMHLLGGGIIRPHFAADKGRPDNWVVMMHGNRVKYSSGESAANYLLGVGYWVSACESDLDRAQPYN